MADLITLEEYKALEGIVSEKEDQRLTETIGSVSALIKSYCNNSFVDYVSADKVQKFNIGPNGALHLFLKETPLISITSVTERTSISASYSTLTNDDYYYDEDTESLLRISGGANILWSAGPGAVIVTYKAGYTPLPEDIKLAAINLVTFFVKEQYKQVSKNIGSTSLTNNTSTNNVMPGHFKRTLDLYRNIL